MLSQIDEILDDISAQSSEKNEYLPEAVQKLLEVMEYDIPYTGNALMERLGLKGKEGFRRNYIHPAVEMNLIQLTISDKPNSRNKRQHNPRKKEAPIRTSFLCEYRALCLHMDRKTGHLISHKISTSSFGKLMW